MAPSKRPTERITSRCTAATARATLVFEIVGYSLHRGIGTGKFIQSAPYSVGGYEWCIRYYPDAHVNADSNDYVSVYLELLSKCADVRVLYDLRLVNQACGLSVSIKPCLKLPTVFNALDASKNTYALGTHRFMKKSDLEESAVFLRDDCLVIECDITVIKEPLVAVTAVDGQMPASDLSDHLGKLLETAEEADVTFNVEGEVFAAHKIVLAMRSPVFKAELYGPMRDKREQNITVEDMQPAVFKALIQFIYTDSMPSMDDLDDDEKKEMVKLLLVAADRYGMERMKTICEGMLCSSLGVENVATTLALADQHHCTRLRDACVKFVTSPNRMDGLVATQGYANLKRSCPTVLVDFLEKLTKSRRI